MTHKKKLIEVAIPLEAINAASRADKNTSDNTIKNLHKWFAPMPLPAMRALVFASLVDAPEDDRELQDDLRLIEELVEGGAEPPSQRVVNAARRRIARDNPELPTVFDPFCGGGSTLVEGQRLGLPVVGGDLNPLPVLIGKLLVELPHGVRDHPPLHPTPGAMLHGEGATLDNFARDVSHYARVVRQRMLESIGDLFPDAPNGETPYVWWWARTVPSPDPRFQGIHTPLVSSWWLTRARGSEAWLEATADADTGTLSFAVRTDGVPPPSSKSTCLFSGAPITFPYIREQGRAGNLGTMLLAVGSAGPSGRVYFAPDDEQRSAAAQARPAGVLGDLPLPEGGLGFRVQKYGITRWSDMFSARQQVVLETAASAVAALSSDIEGDGGSADYAKAIVSFLGLCVGKLAQSESMLCTWRTREGPSKLETAFGQHIVPMTWDFAEANPFGDSRGDWLRTVATALGAYRQVAADGSVGRVRQADARWSEDLAPDSCLVVTDPPYFAAIGYSDLSDYFYPWIREALAKVEPDIFRTRRSPKADELIADPSRHEGGAAAASSYYVNGFIDTFSALRRVSHPDLPLVVLYAYKEKEETLAGEAVTGWEAMLQAIVSAGLQITGTWPVAATGATRLRSQGSNSLDSYVAMVCRERVDSVRRASEREVATEMREAIAGAIPRLQAAGILPVDLSQSVLGPGMAAFSKYREVLKPDGTPMRVRDALLLVNRTLGEVLDEQEGDLDAETRWAAAWYEQHRNDEKSFGEADSLARSKVTTVESLVRAGIVRSSGGVAQLLPRAALPDDYDPREDRRPTVWEGVQHLIKRLEKGEPAAAELLAQLGTRADPVRELSYRLFQICENRGWSDEAQAYNQLIGSWPELARLAGESLRATSNEQQRLL